MANLMGAGDVVSAYDRTEQVDYQPESHPAAQEYIERLRHLHVRVTPQRLLVLEAVSSQGGHLTAEEILQWASKRYPAINLATVYRTLDLLISVGLVSQTDLGGEATYYELVGDAPHHHLVCERCGAMVEMDDDDLLSLRLRLRERYGFEAHPRHVAVFGICAPCQEEVAANP